MKPGPYTLVVMVLAAVAVGTLLLDQYSGGSAPMPKPSVTIAAPPLLYAPDAFYKEAVPPPVVKPVKPRAPGEPVRIAIVIDDVGLSRSQTNPVIALPAPFTLAFLPYGESTPALAQAAAAAGHTVMLHMPMQPVGQQNPGPDALRPGLEGELVAQRLNAALERVPGAVGVNNHMGSAATADATLMDAAMTALQGRGLFFLDSYTNPRSVAYQAAQSKGLPALRRDVFLDNDPDYDAITRQLARAEQVAQQQGHAIVIGHPYDSTLAAIKDWMQADGGLDLRGIKLVSITELLEKPNDDISN